MSRPRQTAWRICDHHPADAPPPTARSLRVRLPRLVLLPGGRDLRGPVPRADVHLVLLRLHAMDALDVPSSSASTTSSPSSAGPTVQGLHQHPDLRRLDVGAKVVLGLLLAVAPDVRHLRARLPARRHLLPGAGLDDRRRDDLQDLCSTRSTASSTRPRGDRDHRTGLAHGSHLAIYSIALVDIWKGVGLATLIYIAGIVAIPQRLLRGRSTSTARTPGTTSGASRSAGAAGDDHGGHPVAHRRPALVRPHLGHDPRRARVRERHHRFGHLQAVPGRATTGSPPRGTSSCSWS